MSDPFEKVTDALKSVSLDDERVVQPPVEIESRKWLIEEICPKLDPIRRWNCDEAFEMFRVSRYDDQYDDIIEKMENRFIMDVKEIDLIQNPFLYSQYRLKLAQKQNMYGHVKEHTLFHGTKECYINSICENNFDWRRMGCNGYRFSKYGCGVSFSPSTCYASAYPRRHEDSPRIMFAVKVLEVSRCLGGDDMIIPPDEHDDVSASSEDYDSSVVVKYFDNEFYPQYIIRYGE